MRLENLAGMMAGIGLSMLVCGQAAAITQDDPLQGQVWEVVISSGAFAQRYEYTMQFEFSGNCIQIRSEQSEPVQPDGLGDDRAIEPSTCQSQFALTSASGDFDGTADYNYTFSYEFEYRSMVEEAFGVEGSISYYVDTAQSDTDCSNFSLMEVGDIRSDICGLPELERQGAHYTSITRTQ